MRATANCRTPGVADSRITGDIKRDVYALFSRRASDAAPVRPEFRLCRQLVPKAAAWRSGGKPWAGIGQAESILGRLSHRGVRMATFDAGLGCGTWQSSALACGCARLPPRRRVVSRASISTRAGVRPLAAVFFCCTCRRSICTPALIEFLPYVHRCRWWMLQCSWPPLGAHATEDFATDRCKRILVCASALQTVGVPLHALEPARLLIFALLWLAYAGSLTSLGRHGALTPAQKRRPDGHVLSFGGLGMLSAASGRWLDLTQVRDSFAGERAGVSTDLLSIPLACTANAARRFRGLVLAWRMSPGSRVDGLAELRTDEDWGGCGHVSACWLRR